MSTRDKERSIQVFNVANPEITSSSSVVQSLRSTLGLDCMSIVPLRQYVQLIQDRGIDDLPIAPFLPYYLSVVDDEIDRFVPAH